IPGEAEVDPRDVNCGTGVQAVDRDVGTANRDRGTAEIADRDVVAGTGNDVRDRPVTRPVGGIVPVQVPAGCGPANPCDGGKQRSDFQDLGMPGKCPEVMTSRTTSQTPAAAEGPHPNALQKTAQPRSKQHGPAPRGA